MVNEADFKGFTGIQRHDFTFSNDMLLVVVLLMLSIFAWLFQRNFPLFRKMINNIKAGRQRKSIFDTTEKNSLLFNVFMTFQAHFLLSILLFFVSVRYGYITQADTSSNLRSIGILLLFFFAFYLFKSLLYAIFGYIFVEKQAFKTMFTNFQALFRTWGILLFIPILWILLIDKHFFLSVIFLAISYIAFLLILILRTVYIYFNKNNGILFLSLYLCALEFVPLLFLYEGLNYTYNIINT